MKQLIAAMLLALIAVLGVGTPALADTPDPDSRPEVISMGAYRNLLETDDRLFIIYANVPYAYLPATAFSNTFIWQLIDTDGTTVLGTTTGYSYVDSGYGYQVYSMYYGADESIQWQPALPYTIRLIGNPVAFDDPPYYDYPINNVDYTPLSDSDDVKAELADKLIIIADDLDLQWGLTTSLIAEDETGQTLSIFGQAYFRGAIYSIQALAPDLFPLAIRNVVPTDRVFGDDYAVDLENQYAGTWIETAKAAGGALFGVDYDLLSMIILLALVIGVILANIYIAHDHWAGLIDAALLLIVGAKLSLVPLGLVGLIAAICIIFMAPKIVSMVRG